MSLTNGEKKTVLKLMIKIAKRHRRAEILEEISYDSDDELSDIAHSRHVLTSFLDAVGLAEFRSQYDGAEKKERKKKKDKTKKEKKDKPKSKAKNKKTKQDGL